MRSVRLLAPLVAALLIVGACGRDNDEAGTGTTVETPEGTGTEGTSATTAGVDASGPGDFGDLQDVCGPGDASGETAQGVTDDSIEVATFSDPGFTGRQGLNQELFDASEVFVAWCNEAGGINGREIVIHERDAKVLEYKQRVTESCQEDFMMVGGGGVFDDTGQEERLTCLLPDMPAYHVSSQARGADLAVRALPNALDELAIGPQRYVEERFPDSTAYVGFMTGNVPTTVIVDEQQQEAAGELGWTTVHEVQYNALGEPSWTPYAQGLQSDGVRGLVYTGEPENMAKLLQALDDIQYQLDWVIVSANHYDQRFIELGGDAVRNVFMVSGLVPFFEASENPATQQFLDLFQQYLPDGKAEALLGAQSFSAWLLFAQAVKACGSEVTRRCVYDEASQVTEWTGGGLHAATNPSENTGARCGLIIEASPDGFSIPDDFDRNDGLFGCRDDTLYILQGDYGEGVTLADVGKSLDDLE